MVNCGENPSEEEHVKFSWDSSPMNDGSMNETVECMWVNICKYVKTRTHCKASHLKAQHGEKRIYVLKAELKMDGSEIV